MRTEIIYSHITFELQTEGKQETWDVKSNANTELIGKVKWHNEGYYWRGYRYEAEEGVCSPATTLRDILRFMGWLKRTRQKRLREEREEEHHSYSTDMRD